MRKPAPPKEIPPPLELECLKALWRLGEGNVHDVKAALTQNPALAYTTVMTILDRLEKRGAAVRRKAGRSYVYAPKLTREVVRKAAVKDLLATYFDDDATSLRQYLEMPVEASPTVATPPTPDNLDAALL